MWALVGGLVAAAAFPLVAVALFQHSRHRRNRRNGRRRTDKIHLG